LNLKNFVITVLVVSFILFELHNFSDQNVDALDNNYYYSGGINFVAPLDPYQIVSQDRGDHELDSYGIVYLSIDPYLGELSYQVFVEGMSYLEGDDVEIIQIHLGIRGQDGPTVLSLCNEKIKEGPGLSVEGVLEEKYMEGPLKGSSFRELINLIESGESYVYVQSRDHPEGEIRGQIFY
jgi:hypothetical protein